MFGPKQLLVRVAVEVLTINLFSILLQTAAEWYSGKILSNMKEYMKQRCLIEFHHEKILPTGIHEHLLNIYRDQTVHVSTVGQCFSLCWCIFLQAEYSLLMTI